MAIYSQFLAMKLLLSLESAWTLKLQKHSISTVRLSIFRAKKAKFRTLDVYIHAVAGC